MEQPVQKKASPSCSSELVLLSSMKSSTVNLLQPVENYNLRRQGQVSLLLAVSLVVVGPLRGRSLNGQWKPVNDRHPHHRGSVSATSVNNPDIWPGIVRTGTKRKHLDVQILREYPTLLVWKL